jgi:hypothetical protein
MPGDLDGLLFTFDLKEKIAADRLLGFDEGTIDDGVALLSRDDLALVGQRVSRGGPALLNQLLEPIIRCASLYRPLIRINTTTADIVDMGGHSHYISHCHGQHF